jgi:putative PIG3 family NAD(P)H quinone oxidoreductase
MKAVLISQPGGPEVLEVRDVPDPVPAERETLVAVRAAGVNRADLLQRRGKYPPPKGASEIPGLEVAGIAEGGPLIGQRVMALLSGGGYAERVAVPDGLLMPVPANLSFAQAAAVPEAFLTAYLELVMLGGLSAGAGQSVLIHAAASGVGTAAIQIARELRARVMVTAGSAAKLALCRDLGAEVLIDYKTEDFAARVAEATAGRGVDVVLDLVGAVHFKGSVDSLATGGRLLLVGTVGGGRAELEWGPLMAKRHSIIASTLRSRPLAERVDLTRRFAEWGQPRLADGRLRPVLDTTFPLSRAADAHRRVEENANAGKVVLEIGRE